MACMIFRRARSRDRERLAKESASAEELEALRVILAHTWEITHWHTNRAEARDRLASQIIAFAGVLLALMPQLDGPLSEISSSCIRMLLAGGAVAAAAFLVAAVLVSLAAVARPVRARADTMWPKRRWKEYRDHPTPASEVLKRQIHGLVGDPEDPAPYKEIAEAADRRETLTRLAIRLMGFGVMVLGVVLTGLLITS